MPVDQTVAAAPSAASRPARANPPRVFSSPTQPSARASAGRKVTSASTPSRDSQEERHWVNARQARSGWPRWSDRGEQADADQREREREAGEPEPARRRQQAERAPSPSRTRRP